MHVMRDLSNAKFYWSIKYAGCVDCGDIANIHFNKRKIFREFIS